eukprot:scaffold146333_cov27-Tisochrysis_lutea.AAC.1
MSPQPPSTYRQRTKGRIRFAEGNLQSSVQEVRNDKAHRLALAEATMLLLCVARDLGTAYFF